jgi:arylsulfatase A
MLTTSQRSQLARLLVPTTRVLNFNVRNPRQVASSVLAFGTLVLRTFVMCVLAFCALAFCVFAFWPSPASADPPPNILLILADDVGHDALGCYGGETYPTPHLDRLAASGIRYDHGYSMPSCHPTRVCLLTGRYPYRLEHPKWGDFPKQYESRTIAQLLKQAGYATAVAGKWQLTMLSKNLQHPHQLGFDEYSLFGWHEGPRYQDPMIWENGKSKPGTEGKYGPDLYCDFMIDFIKRNSKKPFFVWYSMALCHDVTDDLKAPVPHAAGKDRYDSFAEMVSAMDTRVGRMVNALEDLGLRDNTLILFVGDNGSPSQSIARAVGSKLAREPVQYRANGQLVRGGKTQLTDGGTRVPLIASWPKAIQPDQQSQALVDMSDFLPTCVETAKSNVPQEFDLDGVSFATTFSSPKKSARQWAFAEKKGGMWVRDQRYKLYANGKLYDIPNDVLETKPLVELNDAAKIAKVRLKAAMDHVQSRAK